MEQIPDQIDAGRDLDEYEVEDMEIDEVPHLTSTSAPRETPLWRTHRRSQPIFRTVDYERPATPAPFHNITTEPSPQSTHWPLHRPRKASKRSKNTAFTERLARLRLLILPLFPLPMGAPHPSLPRTLLAFYLLTEPELDAIALHYHQSQSNPPHPYLHAYPACMNWDTIFLADPALFSPRSMTKEERECCLKDGERIAIKRRMIGKFVGIGGCETGEEEMQRKMRFYEERIRVQVKRRERMKEESERKDVYWRGGW